MDHSIRLKSEAYERGPSCPSAASQSILLSFWGYFFSYFDLLWTFNVHFPEFFLITNLANMNLHIHFRVKNEQGQGDILR